MQHTENETLPEPVRAAIHNGRIVEAIKILRSQLNIDLREAKEMVDAYIAAGKDQTYSASSGSPGAAGEPVQGDPSSRQLPDRVQTALRKGNKIEAIKLLREEWHIDLKTAKEFVDARQSASGAGMRRPGRQDSSSWRLFFLGIGFFLIALGIYLAL